MDTAIYECKDKTLDRRPSRRVDFVQYIAFITGMLLAYFWGFLMEILLIYEGFQGAHLSYPKDFRSQVHLEIIFDGRGICKGMTYKLHEAWELAILDLIRSEMDGDHVIGYVPDYLRSDDAHCKASKWYS